MHKALLTVLFLAPLVPGCAAAAVGAGAGVLFSQEVLDNQTFVARLDKDANQAWTSTKTTLSHASLKPIDVDNDMRTAIAEVDGAKVTASIETYDLNRSVLKVSAKKYGVSNGDIAKVVFDKVMTELDR